MDHKVSFQLDQNVVDFNGVEGESDGEKSIRSSDQQTTGRQGQEDNFSKEETTSPTINPARIKKRHRRGSKRNKGRRPRYKWKPYNKLTWEEKRKLEERDTLRAERKREQIMKRGGRPIAPYNTTQFLMDEHDNLDLDEESEGAPERQISIDASLSDQDDMDSRSSSDENFYDKEFTEAYDMMHAETLQSLSKDALIENMMELEHKIEHLQREMRKLTDERPLIQQNLVEESNCKDLGSYESRTHPDNVDMNCEVCKSYVAHCDSCSSSVDYIRYLRSQVQCLVDENSTLKCRLQSAKVD